MAQGVVYLAVDDPEYLRYFEISVHSLRALGRYEGPVQLLTNLDPPSGLKEVQVTRLEPVDVPAGLERSRHFKTQLHRLTAFPHTLYLDCDSLVAGDVTDLWSRYPDGVAIARDPHPTIATLQPVDVQGGSEELFYTKELLPPGSPYYCASTLLWRRSEATDLFFSEWHREWRRFRRVDQLALARTLQASPGRPPLHALPREYCFPPVPRDVRALAKEGVRIIAAWGRLGRNLLYRYWMGAMYAP